MEAAEDLASSVGTLQACLGLSVSRATLYRWRARGSGLEVSADRGPAARALSEDERRLILDVLHSERFCDCAPAEVYATLLDEGIYLASASTMYRVLAEEGEVRERRSVHSDRGPAMRSHTVALLLSDLGITKTHSRPYTASDNPYSEAHFKTLKYRPEFPERFSSADDARLFLQAFFGWYNTEHRHSGIGYMTPEVVHYGRADEISDARRAVLLDAHAAHPERFVGKIPEPPALPEEVWINKPEGDDGEEVLP